MTKQFKSDLKKLGLKGDVLFERTDMHAVRYQVNVNDKTFDDGYFIGEVGTANTKSAMIKRWEDFLKTL